MFSDSSVQRRAVATPTVRLAVSIYASGPGSPIPLNRKGYFCLVGVQLDLDHKKNSFPERRLNWVNIRSGRSTFPFGRIRSVGSQKVAPAFAKAMAGSRMSLRGTSGDPWNSPSTLKVRGDDGDPVVTTEVLKPAENNEAPHR